MTDEELNVCAVIVMAARLVMDRTKAVVPAEDRLRLLKVMFDVDRAEVERVFGLMLHSVAPAEGAAAEEASVAARAALFLLPGGRSTGAPK